MKLPWARGREDPFIKAVDPDDNRSIFLYVDHEPGRNTLVPLSEKEHLRYNSIGGRKVLEEKQSYYKDGRENRDEGIMGEDIKRKTMVLEAVLDTAKKRIKDCGWMLGGAVNCDERQSGIEKFRPDVEGSLTNARKILESLRQEYLQLCQESGMASLRGFQMKVQDLETQVMREEVSWTQLSWEQFS